MNQGKEPHQSTLIVLPEDIPPAQEQLQGSVLGNVAPMANNPGIGPGAAGAVAVDLKPGQRYAFVCLLRRRQGPLPPGHGLGVPSRGRQRPAARRPGHNGCPNREPRLNRADGDAGGLRNRCRAREQRRDGHHRQLPGEHRNHTGPG